MVVKIISTEIRRHLPVCRRTDPNLSQRRTGGKPCLLSVKSSVDFVALIGTDDDGFLCAVDLSVYRTSSQEPDHAPSPSPTLSPSAFMPPFPFISRRNGLPPECAN